MIVYTYITYDKNIAIITGIYVYYSMYECVYVYDCVYVYPYKLICSIYPCIHAHAHSLNYLYIIFTYYTRTYIGPNSSGKSVYIKQIGIIVYMTHIGMYIPCTKAIIGICDSIYTRISSTESVLSQHSSFSLDLNQVRL